MGKTIHMCFDLRGTILNWNPEEWYDVVTDTETGKKLSPRQVKSHFLDLLIAGHKVHPFGKECEGFSNQTGCPGHEKETETDGTQA